MKTLFNSYTGNPFLDNALYTLEALGGCNIEEINTEKLKKLFLDPYQKGHQSLMQLNKRLKSYTMLFTKNGPLHNDKEFGERIYNSLMLGIIEDFENEGQNVCELSGLRFDKNFEYYYQTALQKIGYPNDKIKGKDKTINRCWFPLIGGLGSDAQALPQAKRAIQIHPIWVVIMQFLPLSSVIYKGGVLLVDSSNNEFSREMIENNFNKVKELANTLSIGSQIENVKFGKGYYLVTALDSLLKLKREDKYSDLNLWSFSNSGTGASCSIDRVSNDLLSKLMLFYKDGVCRKKFLEIINEPKNTSDESYSFLSCVRDNNDWGGLYPSGKYFGVELPFLIMYYELTGKKSKLDYAKNIAFLIHSDTLKPKSFLKYLENTDAHKEKDYRADVYSVLVRATQNGNWSLAHQIGILDSNDVIPVKNYFFQLYKLIHYCYLNKEFLDHLEPKNNNSRVDDYCKWLISLIDNDRNSNKIVETLTNKQQYQGVTYSEVFLRNIDKIILSDVITIFFEQFSWQPIRIGMNELMRIYYSQPLETRESFEFKKLETEDLESNSESLKNIRKFKEEYKEFYPRNFYSQAISIPNDNKKFINWLSDILTKHQERAKSEKEWEIEDFIYSPNGEKRFSFAKFAMKFIFLNSLDLDTLSSEEPVELEVEIDVEEFS